MTKRKTTYEECEAAIDRCNELEEEVGLDCLSPEQQEELDRLQALILEYEDRAEGRRKAGRQKWA